MCKNDKNLKPKTALHVLGPGAGATLWVTGVRAGRGLRTWAQLPRPRPRGGAGYPGSSAPFRPIATSQTPAASAETPEGAAAAAGSGRCGRRGSRGHRCGAVSRPSWRDTSPLRIPGSERGFCGGAAAGHRWPRWRGLRGRLWRWARRSWEGRGAGGRFACCRGPVSVLAPALWGCSRCSGLSFLFWGGGGRAGEMKA